MRSIALANQAWCAALARALLAGGVRHVVVSPGSRSTPLVLAFAEHQALVTHTVLDERSAGFFALGLAKASGEPAVLLCTSGSAALHYGPAVAEAAHSEVPLLVLTADRPPELHGCAAPQTLDQQRLFGAHVAFFANLCTPTMEASSHSWGVMAAQALDAAQERRGPAHLNVPLREPLWCDDLPAAPAATAPAPQVVRGPASLATDAVARLAATLGAIPRGVIVCGPRRAVSPEDDFGAAVAGLAARLGWPVLAETASGLRWGPHAGPNLIAGYDAMLRHAAFAEDHLPSFVLRLGSPPTSKTVNLWLQRAARAATHTPDDRFSVAVSPSGRWQDPTGSVDTVLALPEAALCAALAQALPSRIHSGPWLKSWTQAEAQTQAALSAACDGGFLQGRLARMLIDVLPNRAALHVASSMPIRDLDNFAPVSDKSVRVFCNRGLNGIDGTLATLFGEAAAGVVPMVGVVGDLAFLHDAASLALAPALGDTPVTVVVVNNGGGAIFEHLAIAKHPTAFEPFFRTPQPQDLAAVCRGYGVPCDVVDAEGDVRGILTHHVGRPGAQVVEVRMPQEGLAHYRAAWQKVGAALVNG